MKVAAAAANASGFYAALTTSGVTEIVLVTAGGTTTTWTITRGQGSPATTAASHNDGDSVVVILTAAALLSMPTGGDVTGAANATVVGALANGAIAVSATAFTAIAGNGAFAWTQTQVAGNGSGAGAAWSVTGQQGQANSTNSGTAGAGSAVTVKAGAGGVESGTTSTGGAGGALNLSSGGGGTGTSTNGAAGAINLQSAGTTILQLASSTSFVPNTDNSVILGTAAKRWSDIRFLNCSGYGANTDASASVQITGNAATAGSAFMAGGGINFGPSGGTGQDIWIAHTANAQEILIGDTTDNNCIAFLAGSGALIQFATNAVWSWGEGIITLPSLIRLRPLSQRERVRLLADRDCILKPAPGNQPREPLT